MSFLDFLSITGVPESAIHLLFFTPALSIKHRRYRTVEVVVVVNAASPDHKPLGHIHVAKNSTAFFFCPFKIL